MKNYNKSLSGEMDLVCDDQTVSGYFTSDTVDVDGHIIFKEDIIAKMQEYVQWGNVRADHQRPIGTMIAYDPMNWNYFKVKVVDDNAWKLVREKVYKGFSLGLKVAETGLKRIPLSQIPPEKYAHLPEAVVTRLKSLGFVERIKDFYIAEISITDRPRNTKSVITYNKSDGDEQLPSLMEEIMDENNVLDNGEDTQKSEPTITKDEHVVDEVAQVAEPTTIVKSDMVEDPACVDELETVEDACKTDEEKKDDADMSKAENAAQEWKDAFNSLSTKLDSVVRELTIALSDVSTKLEGLSGMISKSDEVAVSKSNALDTEKPQNDLLTFKDELINELKSFVKSEFGESTGERKNSVNQGDGINDVKPLDLKGMDKSEGYSVIANIIAKNLKG